MKDEKDIKKKQIDNKKILLLIFGNYYCDVLLKNGSFKYHYDLNVPSLFVFHLSHSLFLFANFSHSRSLFFSLLVSLIFLSPSLSLSFE